ncbi:MAG: glycosyltransferase family 39 protein [Anaerolineales bacterium]|nr:glycosyltransferase family 39 protein [Anaerolineales bacterium]
MHYGLPNQSAAVTKHWDYRLFILAALLIAALAIRVHKINSPLWLDEIYSYRLARLSFVQIIQNSWIDPHPPLFYLLQWMLSAGGQIRSEIGWRMLPLLCGMSVVFIIWLISTDLANSLISLVICAIAVASPTLVYFSQEARPQAALTLLSALSMWLTEKLLINSSNLKLWVLWIGASLLGLYTGYVYLMIVGVQLVFLGYYNYRKAIWWVAVFLISGCLLSLYSFALSGLAHFSSTVKVIEPLTLWRSLQMLLAGDPVRYGTTIAHHLLPAMMVGLLIASTLRSVRLRDRRLIYFLVQGILPMSLFFTLSPLAGIRLPQFEARHFIVFLPALFALMSSGFMELSEWLATYRKSVFVVSLIAAGGLMICLNLIGLHSYWEIPKSPEGLAVLYLRELLRPGESVVSFYHGVNYSLWFYLPGVTVYIYPKEGANGYIYQQVNSAEMFESSPLKRSEKTSQAIRTGGRFWVLALSSDVDRESVSELISVCRIVARKTFSAPNGSFDLMKVKCSTNLQSPSLEKLDNVQLKTVATTAVIQWNDRFAFDGFFIRPGGDGIADTQFRRCRFGAIAGMALSTV